MANYDKPAYTWVAAAKTINLDVELNDFDIPIGANDITPTLLPASFGGTVGGSTTPEGDPIYGYGWGLSG